MSDSTTPKLQMRSANLGCLLAEGSKLTVPRPAFIHLLSLTGRRPTMGNGLILPAPLV